MATIVDIAVGAGSFTTLVAAVQVADLVGALQSPGPFTVFAPTDEAFAKLPPGTVDTLVINPPQLARILTYHVVAGALNSDELKTQSSLTSLEGSCLDLHQDPSGTLEVNNATIVTPDIEAENGVIHVIDTVILMRPHWFGGMVTRWRQVG